MALPVQDLRIFISRNYYSIDLEWVEAWCRRSLGEMLMYFTCLLDITGELRGTIRYTFVGVLHVRNG